MEDTTIALIVFQKPVIIRKYDQYILYTTLKSLVCSFVSLLMPILEIFSGMPEAPALLEHRKDRLLEDLLVKYDVMSLYNAFASNSITNDVIWDLKDEYLKDMGLTIGDILKYNKARDKAKIEEMEGK